MSSDNLAQLRQISDRMTAINSEVSQRVIATSAEPNLMAQAYDAIRGEGSGANGMAALRLALLADGVAEEEIDAIGALYVRCLLDPSL